MLVGKDHSCKDKSCQQVYNEVHVSTMPLNHSNNTMVTHTSLFAVQIPSKILSGAIHFIGSRFY